MLKTSRAFDRSCCMVALLGGAPLCLAGDAASQPVGWRTDARGSYRDAMPPTRWSATENVVWKSPMPGKSYGSPVIVDDAIFVVSDPAELLRVRATDGEILWRRSNTAAEAVGAEQAQKVLAEWNALNDRKRQLERDFNELRKARPDDKEEHDRFKKQLESIEQQLSTARRNNPIQADRGSSNTAATPVCDGRHVYAVFGSGVVAAYTLAGEARWIKFIEGSDLGFGHSSSPVLIGDKLIVHFQDLVALDAKAGEVVWRTPLSPQHATPIAVRLGTVDAIASPSGKVVRASDGKVLFVESALQVSEGSSITQAGVLYAQGDKTSAFKLPTSDAATSLELLWNANASRGRRTPSPVLHDGLLYGATTEGILDVTDVQTGDVVYRKRLELGENLYSSVTAAGDFLYLSSTKGTTLVFKPGREFEEVARNELESLGSNPIFAGRRMYIRGHKNLYCIGQ